MRFLNDFMKCSTDFWLIFVPLLLFLKELKVHFPEEIGPAVDKDLLPNNIPGYINWPLIPNNIPGVYYLGGVH